MFAQRIDGLSTKPMPCVVLEKFGGALIEMRDTLPAEQLAESELY